MSASATPVSATPAAKEIAKGSLATSKAGTVSSFRAETAARAKAQGFTKATKGQMDTFTKKGLIITVQHSEKDYVRTVTVNGTPEILPGHKEKHIKLQKLLLAS